MGMEVTPNEPKPLNQLLGYVAAGIPLARGHYPVNMTRESLDGQILGGPHEFEDESALTEFSKQAEVEERKSETKGYWRIRSL